MSKTDHTPLAYERWALRFEEIVVSDLLAHPLAAANYEAITTDGVLKEAEDLLLVHLAGDFLFDGEPDPIENPPVPAAIAGVAAEQQAAASLFVYIFAALFEPEVSASVYTAGGGYDGDGGGAHARSLRRGRPLRGAVLRGAARALRGPVAAGRARRRRPGRTARAARVSVLGTGGFPVSR